VLKERKIDALALCEVGVRNGVERAVSGHPRTSCEMKRGKEAEMRESKVHEKQWEGKRKSPS